MEPIVIFVLAVTVLVLITVFGIFEKKRNQKNLEKLMLRINVNGIRGKSTATRMITSVLWEAGFKAIGKTTGTAARMMFWDTDREQEVKRLPKGVSIGEQLRVIDKAVEYGADSLVCECMAVKPVYQSVYQHQIIKADITVIVNVLEDHLDEMGPTTKQISEAFADTIPYNGRVVIPDCEFTPYFKKVARERNTKYFVINDDEVDDSVLDLFDYRLFKHNIAVALAAADAMGIDRDTAMRGILKAHPDPGALRVYSLKNSFGEYKLVNAFAANEPESTLDIWNVVSQEYKEAETPVILMNCRPDRVDRTRQFVNDFFPKIPNAVLIAVGENTKGITRAYEKGKLSNVVRYLNFDKQNPDKVISEINSLLPGKLLICVGNIHGHGELVLDELLLQGGAPRESTMAYEKEQSSTDKPDAARPLKLVMKIKSRLSERG